MSFEQANNAAATSMFRTDGVSQGISTACWRVTKYRCRIARRAFSFSQEPARAAAVFIASHIQPQEADHECQSGGCR